MKTFTFALMHFSVAFAVTYLLTGSIVLGGAIALIEPAVNTLGYYFHERIWAKINRRDITLHTPYSAGPLTPLVSRASGRGIEPTALH